MTANGAVSWIEYVASLAALYVFPTAIAVVRRARYIERVTPSLPYGDGVSAAWDAPVNGTASSGRCCVGLSPGPSRGTGTGSMATSRNRQAS